MSFAETPGTIFLPYEIESDEPELESDLHRDQIDLLLACLRWYWRDRNDFYATGNLTIYYSPERITTRDFRGPDFFVVLGVENRPRKSWVLWAEGYKFPNVIVEFLSDSTARVDRTEKKKLYQNTFHTPEYFWFDPDTMEFKGFRLVNDRYRTIKPNRSGWLWSEELKLFLGVYESKLRLFTPTSELVPSPQERAELAEQQAELAQQQAETERQQREKLQQQVEELQARLRSLGLD